MGLLTDWPAMLTSRSLRFNTAIAERVCVNHAFMHKRPCFKHGPGGQHRIQTCPMTTVPESGTHHLHPVRQFNGSDHTSVNSHQPARLITRQALARHRSPDHRELDDEPPPLRQPLAPRYVLQGCPTFTTVDCQPI